MKFATFAIMALVAKAQDIETSGQLMGGWSKDYQEVDKDSEDFTMFKSWLPDVESFIQGSGENLLLQVEKWEPKYYKSQVVAGLNYDVAYCDGDKWMMVKVF